VIHAPPGQQTVEAQAASIEKKGEVENKNISELV
jgi:hypothetical protein